MILIKCATVVLPNVLQWFEPKCIPMVLPNVIEWILPNGFMDSAPIGYNRFLLPGISRCPRWQTIRLHSTDLRGGLRPITNHGNRIGGRPAADQKTMGMKSEPWE